MDATTDDADDSHVASLMTLQDCLSKLTLRSKNPSCMGHDTVVDRAFVARFDDRF